MESSDATREISQHSSPTLSNQSLDTSDTFEVEEIVDSWCSATGDVVYYVKWKGFGDSENTWEPAEKLGKLRNFAALTDFRRRDNHEMEWKSADENDNANVSGAGM